MPFNLISPSPHQWAMKFVCALSIGSHASEYHALQVRPPRAGRRRFARVFACRIVVEARRPVAPSAWQSSVFRATRRQRERLLHLHGVGDLRGCQRLDGAAAVHRPDSVHQRPLWRRVSGAGQAVPLRDAHSRHEHDQLCAGLWWRRRQRLLATVLRVHWYVSAPFLERHPASWMLLPALTPLVRLAENNAGGTGGGAILIRGGSGGVNTASGTVRSNGCMGLPVTGTSQYNWWISQNSQDGSGGGGSGGSIKIEAVGPVNFGSSRLEVNGGGCGARTGWGPSPHQAGGHGSYGRIHVRAPSTTGSVAYAGALTTSRP